MSKIIDNIQEFLSIHFESEVITFILEHIPEESIKNGNYFFITNLHQYFTKSITSSNDLMISSPLLNDLGDINRGLLKVHNSLKERGIFIGRVETLGQRKSRIASFHNRLIFKVIVSYELIFKRILPKLIGFRYIFRTSGIMRHRVLSKCEALGRLQYCGFEILGVKETDRFLYFVSYKNLEPSNQHPYDGMLITIPKVGEHGHTIYCYKLRTMHAYANYLHNYILNNHQIDNEGKIEDDYRMTGWGRFLRKTWIDEMPQLLNIMKGDLSFVGLRPLSREFLSLYPEDWQKERVKIKPGFVPPYYADCPKTFKEIIESEKHYYEAKKKYPAKTDFIYFFRVVWSFLSGRARTG
ncbi:sugar transferase [candidate division WOR-3 bacterium]|nr:sugar transferase [candidate division WOR-3 bacterium]